jgi:hypothetical protein
LIQRTTSNRPMASEGNGGDERMGSCGHPGGQKFGVREFYPGNIKRSILPGCF